MTDERATVRPVTLARLVELTDACNEGAKSTAELETELDVNHRRARETILEATRIGLLEETEVDETPYYGTTSTGEAFLAAIRAEEWHEVSHYLATGSPHYSAFLEAVETDDRRRGDLDDVLERLEEAATETSYSYNQTSVEVLGDWAERLGRVQRNAFTGAYYPTTTPDADTSFATVLLDAYDSLEQTAGVDLRQRYLSIPRLREEVCERLGWHRVDFDSALVELCQANVGKLELSGAPMDTGAKDAVLGIRQIQLAEADGLVSTTQSSQQVMAGVELFDKKYYYLAVHDRNITTPTETNS